MPKKEYVRQMFDEIAPTYDRLNHMLSLNVDKLWRKRALREIVDGTPQRILDVACGTGDSTIVVAKASAPGSRVTGVDISEGMLGRVMDKARAAGVEEKLTLQVADGEDLPFEEDTFHRVVCAFGIRNFEHKRLGLKEFYRVLRPEGKVVILELSVPRNRMERWFYDLYFQHILPWIGGRVSGAGEAYRYLPASVHAFPPPERFVQMLKETGFKKVRCKTYSAGLCRLFIGKK